MRAQRRLESGSMRDPKCKKGVPGVGVYTCLKRRFGQIRYANALLGGNLFKKSWHERGPNIGHAFPSGRTQNRPKSYLGKLPRSSLEVCLNPFFLDDPGVCLNIDPKM